MRNGMRLAVVLVVQVLILAAVPARKVLARASGAEVTLRTRPVDPYDMLAGYYVTLGYEAEDAPWHGVEPKEGETVYVTVVRDQPAWRAVELTRQPQPRTADRASIRATWQHTWRGGRALLTEANRLYVPETQRTGVADELRESKGQGLVDMKVADDGTPAVLRLHVGSKVWGE